jgi:hypothetical protein
VSDFGDLLHSEGGWSGPPETHLAPNLQNAAVRCTPPLSLPTVERTTSVLAGDLEVHASALAFPPVQYGAAYLWRTTLHEMAPLTDATFFEHRTSQLHSLIGTQNENEYVGASSTRLEVRLLPVDLELLVAPLAQHHLGVPQ